MSERANEKYPGPAELTARADELLETVYTKKSWDSWPTVTAGLHVVHILPPDTATESGAAAYLYKLHASTGSRDIHRYEFRRVSKKDEEFSPRHLAMTWDNTPDSTLIPGVISDNPPTRQLSPEEQHTLCQALLEGQPYDPDIHMLHENPDGTWSVMLRETWQAQQQDPAFRAPGTLGALAARIFDDGPLD